MKNIIETLRAHFFLSNKRLTFYVLSKKQFCFNWYIRGFKILVNASINFMRVRLFTRSEINHITKQNLFFFSCTCRVIYRDGNEYKRCYTTRSKWYKHYKVSSHGLQGEKCHSHDALLQAIIDPKISSIAISIP